MYDPNSENAALGNEAQENADAFLKSIGKAIIDVHQSGNGAAALVKSENGARLAMDTAAIGDGEVWFTDSKGKTTSTFTRMTQAEQHGIDARNWDCYIGQCAEAGVDGFLIVTELMREIDEGQHIGSNQLLVYPLSEVLEGYRRVDSRTASYGNGGMIYWNREAFIYEEDLN